MRTRHAPPQPRTTRECLNRPTCTQHWDPTRPDVPHPPHDRRQGFPIGVPPRNMDSTQRTLTRLSSGFSPLYLPSQRPKLGRRQPSPDTSRHTPAPAGHRHVTPTAPPQQTDRQRNRARPHNRPPSQSTVASPSPGLRRGSGARCSSARWACPAIYRRLAALRLVRPPECELPAPNAPPC